MSKVIVDMSMSLDGYIAGVNDTIERPLGEGGHAIHQWLFSGDTVSRYNEFFKLSRTSCEVFDESFASTGAIIVGRRTYDVVGGWGGNHPIRGVSVFVLTHEVPNHVPEGATSFTFITDGIESAVLQAKEAAGGKHVGVAGASVSQQCMKAGLLDEIHIHLVPVFLTRGIPLFDAKSVENLKLEKVSVIDAPGVTHLKYWVNK